jgi:20S proteasome subunit beta 4
MDTVFAIEGKDFVLMVCDSTATYSIMKLKTNEDKIKQLDEHKLMAIAGDSANRVQFSEYIHKNMSLSKFRNNWTMSMSEAAFYVR